VNTIGNALKLAMAAQIRLAALEDLLKERDAELYATYRNKVESQANYREIDMNDQALEGLRAKLVQDYGR
jgi:hypothetical protein